jgi:hypothetical protein
MKFKNVLPIAVMLLVVFLSGCKKEEDTGLRPNVTSTVPLNNAKSIAIGSAISANFSMAMNPATISVLSFTLQQGNESVSGATKYADTTATFTPALVLAPNTIYKATITTAVKNVSGNTLLKDFVWSFTTGDIPDLTSPAVTLTNPLNSATEVAIDHLIVITFSEPMDPTSINSLTYTLKQGSTSVAGAVSYTGTAATFAPAGSLDYSKVYTGTITSGAKDIKGNALASNYTFSFTTVAAPDTLSPTVSLTNPENNAIGVAIDHLVVTTFSEPMDPATLTALTYTLKQGTTAVNGSVSYSGEAATFTPSANLEPGKTYTGTITSGAKDIAGNALASNYTFSFTTVLPDLTLPTIISTDPLNTSTNVVLNKVVAITFSEAMDPLTITTSTFTLMQGTTAVTGAVTYSGTTAIFTPSNLLTSDAVYTATITTGAKDLAGNALETNTVWSFTANTSAIGQAVVNLGAAGNYVILAKTGISNISTSAITGDLGLSPAATSYITGLSLTNATGYATSAQVTGSIFAADMAAPTGINLTTAVENMITAYNDAAGRPTPDFLELGTGNIGGKTLTPGLYKWTTTVTLPSDVTISGGANDVWIFQISQNLLMSNGVNINLIGGAQAKNIFWQVAGQATLGTTSHFEGVILSMTGITFQTGASFKGRALAQTAVVLDGNAVILP